MMPVHQISVVPAKETSSNGRSSGKGKDRSKEENDKAPRRSGSRTSNISKASSSTTGIGHNGVSRTSVTPSSQDICSLGALPKLEEDASEQTVHVSALASTGSQGTKRLVKRRYRRKRESRQASENLEGPLQPEDGHASRVRWEHLRRRNGCQRETDSSSDEELEKWRQARNWSRKRARRRNSSSHQPEESKGKVADGTDAPSSSMPVGRAPPCGALKNRRRTSGGRQEHRTRPVLQRVEKSGCGNVPAMGPTPKSSSPSEEGGYVSRQCNRADSGHSDPVTTPGGWAASQNGAVRHFTDDDLELCRICHCEGDEDCPLITPCRCTGSLRFVHPDCLHQWIKSSDTRCCELCKYDFIMETQLKPLRKWEKLQMSTRERRQIFCSVSFHIIAVICVVWSLYVLIDRTAEEIKQGRENGVLEWPFWTKLIVVAIGFTGGLIFMYIQCKVYLQLWRRLKAYNRIIFVQNCPDAIKKAEERTAPASQANGKHDSVEVPVPQTETNSHRASADDAVPEVAPV